MGEMGPLPGWFLETLNGWAALALPWTIWTAARYLRRRRRELGVNFRTFRRQSAMAISVFVILLGAEVRSAVAWLTRHGSAHHWPFQDFGGTFIVPLLYAIGATALVLGSLCWSRTAADAPIGWKAVWAITFGALLFAYWFAAHSPV